MIRWSYVLPRLTIALAIVLAFWLGTDSLLRWSLIRAGQRAVGAKVELGDVTTSLRQGRIHIQSLQIANPNSPLKNLMEASEMQLVVDVPALLHRQLVVHDGAITGLKFSGQRATSGALPDSEKPSSIDGGKLGEQALEWLESLGRLLNENVVDELESVKVARDVAERWPREYHQLAEESERFKQRVQSLRDAVRQAKDRPLENVDTIHRAASEVATLREHLQWFHQRLAQLQHQVMMDKDNIEHARRRDIDRIDDAMRIDLIDPHALGEFVLGPELSPYFDQAIEWTSWAKQWLDVAGDPPRPARDLGRVIEFPRYNETPDLLIEQLRVAGEARLDGLPLPFEGRLTGITSDPQRYGQPVRLDVTIDGQAPARLQAIVDRTGEQTVQRLMLDCPALALAPRTLGKSGVFTLALPKSSAHVWFEMTLHEEKLDGRIIWKQQGLNLRPEIGQKYGGARLANRLRSALTPINKVDAVVRLAGPAKRPTMKLESTLGAELATGLQQAAHQELAEHRDALVTRVNVEIAEEMTRLDELVAQHRQKALGYLQVGEQVMGELQQIAGSLAGLRPDLLY